MRGRLSVEKVRGRWGGLRHQQEYAGKVRQAQSSTARSVWGFDSRAAGASVTAIPLSPLLVGRDRNSARWTSDKQEKAPAYLLLPEESISLIEFSG